MRVCVFCLLLLPLLAVGAYADLLGTAGNFAVLGGSETTNTGSTTIIGDYGVWPGSSLALTGVTLTGTPHKTDAVAKQAQIDLTTAYLGLNALVPTTQYLTVDQNLAGLTLTSGVYKINRDASLTGTSADPGVLTLDAQGLANQLFVFQIGRTLITSSANTGSSTSAQVQIINAGANDSVYWVVGSAATIGTYTQFEGNILSFAQIALETGATIDCGRALNQTGGPVTMDTNTISIGCIGTNESGSHGLSSPNLSFDTNGNVVVSAAVPEPGTLLLLGSIIGVLAAQRRWARARA